MRTILSICFALAVMGLVIPPCSAAKHEVVSEMFLEYEHEGTICEGFVVYSATRVGRRPGVIVIHEWNGITPQVMNRCRKLAGLGYVAFAADIYGKGIRPATREEAAKQARIYRENRALMRGRAKASLAAIRRLPQVDPAQIAVMGYCFGGGVALELARSGADVLGVVSFHGNLDTPVPEDARNIRAKVLILHGAADPHVPMNQVQGFHREMETADTTDWQLVMYGHAVHSFTNPQAGDDPADGTAYNEKADRRSWEAMKAFFEEVFTR